MHRIFAAVALAAASLGLWVLIVGPEVDPFGGSPRVLSQAPVAYSAWAWGLLMGLVLGWLAMKDWSRLPDWLRALRQRAGLVLLGGLFASMILLF